MSSSRRGGASPAGRSWRRPAPRRRRPTRRLLSLPPKPPPMRRTTTVTRLSRQPSTRAHDVLDLGRVLGRGMDDACRRPRPAWRTRSGLRDRNAPARRRVNSRARAGAAPPSAPRRDRRAAWSAAPAHRPGWRAPSSMSRIAGSALDLDRRALGGARAPHRGSSPRPAPAAGRRYSTWSSANSGSSLPAPGDVVLAGMSAAVSTATTPGAATAGDRSSLLQAAVRDRAQPSAACSVPARLRHVVDIERLAGDVLQRAVVALRGMDARPLTAPRPRPARCGSATRQLEPAQQVGGDLQAIGGARRASRRAAGSPARQRAARSTVAVESRPSAAPPRRGCARFGVAAMPPKAMRTSSIRAVLDAQAKAPATAEMSWSRRLEILSQTEASRPATGLRQDEALDDLVRRQRGLAVAEEEILQRQLARAARRDERQPSSPSAISTGGMSPIGEPLAILPPIVPMVRTCREPSRAR